MKPVKSVDAGLFVSKFCKATKNKKGRNKSGLSAIL